MIDNTRRTLFNLPLISTLLHYFRFYRERLGGRIYFYFFLTGFGTLLEVVGVGTLVPLINLATKSMEEEPSSLLTRMVMAVLTFFHLPQSLVGIFVLIGIIVVVRGICLYWQNILQERMMANLMVKLRMELVNRFSGISFLSYAKQNVGYFTNLIVNDSITVSTAFACYVLALAALVTAAFYLAGIALIRPLILVVAIVMSVAVLYAFKSLLKISRHYSRLMTEANARLNNLLIQSVQSFRYLKATARFSQMLKRLEEVVSEVAEIHFLRMRPRHLVTALAEPIALGMAILLFLVDQAVHGGNLLAMMPMLYLFYRATRQVQVFQSNWQTFHSTLGSLENFSHATARFEEDREKTGADPLPERAYAVELRNVELILGDKPVLRGLTMQIQPGEMIGIAGTSGAGKTSTINLLLGLMQPSAGSVHIAGRDLRTLDLDEVRRSVGYVVQEGHIYNDTIAYNIAMEAVDESDREGWQRIRHAAELARATEFIEELPEGYRALIGDRGMTLSGGQCQRLQIARELYRQPSLLILDEATSNLDSQHERLIQETIDQMKGKLTTIVIAHRLSTLRRADRIYVLSGGRIAEQGSFDELASRPDSLFNQLLAAQRI